MSTAFGPQSPNYTVARPAVDPEVSAGAHTWFKDCTGPGQKDGTVFSASWFNIITAQMREAVSQAGVPLDNSDDQMLWKAMQAAAAVALGDLTAANGIVRVGNEFRLAVGTGTLPVLTATV